MLDFVLALHDEKTEQNPNPKIQIKYTAILITQLRCKNTTKIKDYCFSTMESYGYCHLLPLILVRNSEVTSVS